MYAIAQQCLKINTSLLAAAFVTFALFFFMTFLIHSDDQREQVARVIPIVDATMPDIVQDIPEQLIRPEPIEEIQEIETLPEDRPVSGNGIPFPEQYVDPVEIDLPDTSGLVMMDSSMVPLVRSTAPYPTRALQRHIEGFVIVSFTVNEMGNVVEPRVMYEEPEGYFGRAALQSIAKWRYQPRVVDGKPIPVQGVQQRIVFQIAE